MKIEQIRSVIRNNRLVMENMSYMSFLQVFVFVYPLITYPYLVEVLGRELYGVVLTAQMLASYASTFIDFGSNHVSVKHVSINRDSPEKLSEILSNVLFARFILFVLIFFVYIAICLAISRYRQNFWIFFLTYGFTTNELLFPQFLFQGLEKMKLVSVINVTVKALMICLIFYLVKGKEDVLLVPIIYSIGFFVGGIMALYQIMCVMKIRFVRPTKSAMMFYVKDSSPVFATNLIMTVKNQFNYLLMGANVCMSDVVIYDLGIKVGGVIGKPSDIINTVLFPGFAKGRNISRLKKTMLCSLSISLVLFILANIFLKDISMFFLHEEVDLIPIRLLLLAPIMLSVSGVICQSLFIAFGYNKYVFYSIVVTTGAYVVALLIFWLAGLLNGVYGFVCISLVAYFAELIYRLIKYQQIKTFLSRTQ